MKVSVNWLKQCIDFELPPMDELTQQIGAQLGAVEEVIDVGAKYQGIVIAKVVKVEKHPNADKLSVCQIDAGKNDLIQVVCGAPNVREGMLAVWLPPGTTVPSTVGKDEFALETRDIRGEKSNGMLASPKELALGDSHGGLLELDDGQPGDNFAKTYQLDDTIIDIENKMFTHRPDCFGLLGVAREIAGIQQTPFKSPDWYTTKPTFPAVATKPLPFKIQNELPKLTPRFTAITMGDVKVGASPVWLQAFLSRMGVKPINNIVDLTNYYMLLTGQPLHAYDYDKVKARSGGNPVLVIRHPKPGEKLKLLNGKTIEPRAEAIMIATDQQLIGIGGVMGGSETEVDTETKNIILECANFDMYSVRRTSMQHGLFTDAATRFTKGQSPLQCLAVLHKLTDDILELGLGEVASHEDDNNHIEKRMIETDSLQPEPIVISRDFVNRRLGLDLSDEQIIKLLENVEFHCHTAAGEICITAPFWRTDIEIPEDIVEEVGRLYGYDHLPLKLPKRDLRPAPKDPLLELKANIRSQLAKAGANEVLTYSFVHGNLLDKVGQDRSQAFQVSNALSPDLQYYRLSLTPSLLEKIHPNIKAGYGKFALFEIGKAHFIDKHDEAGLPREFDRLALVLASKQKAAGAAYYQTLEYLMNLLAVFGIADQVSAEPIAADEKDSAAVYYAEGRAATVTVNEQVLGRIGEFKPSVQRALKLPAYAAGFEIDLQPLLENQQAQRYEPLSRFPKVTQDMTLRLPAEVPYQELDSLVAARIKTLQPKRSTTKLLPIDIFQREDNKKHKQITFRLEIANYDRTLTDPEINKLLDDVAAAAKEKFGAERI